MRKNRFNPIVVILMTFLLQSVVWGASKTTSTDRINVQSVRTVNTNPEQHATIQINYPKFNNIAHADDLNQLILDQVNRIVTTFKNDLTENGPQSAIEGLPLTNASNSLTIDYKTFYVSRALVSIRFSIDTMHYGAAHPLTGFESFNYDVLANKMIHLPDLFKNDKYLNVLENYCKIILTEKLTHAAKEKTLPYAEGLKPEIQSFKVWNFTHKGLFITFNPYQVAAYVFGPQEVLVPYPLIRDYLKKPTPA